MTVKLFRVRVQSLFRTTGLLHVVENLRYHIKCLEYRKGNRTFIKENAGFVLPPAHLAFDAYNAPKWNFYKNSGEESAPHIKKLAEQYLSGRKSISVYEWGCGPGRVVRHLPTVFGNSAEIFGSDYNEETINWCKKNIPGVQFSLNGLLPPLDYPDNRFDLIYCISVFTHLSGDTGIKWADELYRVLKPGGILLLTSLGEKFYNTELLRDEKKKYDEDGIVIRGQYKEGKKMFLTIHHPHYVRQVLLKKFEILQHLPTGFPHVPQECWIVRKD
jgi:ubiquinone/menaquinone biosynthesis C-methylase UbiE